MVFRKKLGIQKFDLQLRLLEMAAQQLWHPASHDWPVELYLEPDGRVDEEAKVLELLGAIDGDGLTEVGRQMEPFVTDGRFAISPRLTKVILEAAKIGLTAPVIDVVSLLAAKEPMYRGDALGTRKEFQKEGDKSDLSGLLNLEHQLRAAVRRGGETELRKFCESRSLSRKLWYKAHDYKRHLMRLAQSLGMPLDVIVVTEETLIKLFLHGFGDRLLRSTSDFEWDEREWIWATGIEGGPGVTRASVIRDKAKQRGVLAFGISLVIDSNCAQGQFDIAALSTPEQLAKTFGNRVTMQKFGGFIRDRQLMCEERWYLNGDRFFDREVVAPSGYEVKPAAHVFTA